MTEQTSRAEVTASERARTAAQVGRSRRPILLDAFSCAGLVSDGYQHFFEVVCLDNDPRALRHAAQAGYHTIEGDAMELLADPGFLSDFDVIHASPPCQADSATRKLADAQGKGAGRGGVSLVEPVRDLLEASGLPYVIENVERSQVRHMPGAVRLCGSSFWLKVQRHRWFAPGGGLTLEGTKCHHDRFEPDPVSNKPRPWGVYYAKGDNIPSGGRTVLTLEHGLEAMCVGRTLPWKYLCEGLPPAYGRFLGRQIAAQLHAEVAA